MVSLSSSVAVAAQVGGVSLVGFDGVTTTSVAPAITGAVFTAVAVSESTESPSSSPSFGVTSQ